LGLSKKYLIAGDCNWTLKYARVFRIHFNGRIQNYLKRIQHFCIKAMHGLMVMGILCDWAKFVSSKHKRADFH
jgi:hypothetical protein